MKKAILATKVGMTQIFNEDGVLTPVTVLQAGPCVVTQVKTVENDGYDAVQVGFADIREKLVNKPVTKKIPDEYIIIKQKHWDIFKNYLQYSAYNCRKEQLLRLKMLQ